MKFIRNAITASPTPKATTVATMVSGIPYPTPHPSSIAVPGVQVSAVYSS